MNAEVPHTKKFILVNGKMTETDGINPDMVFLDASFRLSQKMWYGFGGIPLFYENLELLKTQAEVLKLPFPAEFENERELFRLTKRMLNKNKFYRSGNIHFQLFWNNESVHTLITCNAFENFDFPVSKEGLLVTFSKQKKNSGNTLSRFAFFNEGLWQAGLAEIRDTYFQQVIFLNEKDAICECARANIFMVKGNELFTPSSEAGSYIDVLKPLILDTATQSGLNVTERKKSTIPELWEMDEIFIASEILGFQWIMGIENKRFLHHYSGIIYQKLNERLSQTNS